MCISHTCKDNSKGLMVLSQLLNEYSAKKSLSGASLTWTFREASTSLKTAVRLEGDQILKRVQKRRPEKDYLSKDFSLKNL